MIHYDAEGNRTTPLSNAERVWHEIELFGIIIDDDLEYYFPDAHDTTVCTINTPSFGG
jgi:hypothetical protein